MSTNAVIFVEKPNGKYDGVEVNFDGYIRSATVNRFGRVISWIEGLGWHLNHYWDDYDDILKLCKGRNVRSIDRLDVEEYNDTSRYLKNISKDEMEELRHNYCYSYLYAFSDERGENAGWLDEVRMTGCSSWTSSLMIQMGMKTPKIGGIVMDNRFTF